MAKVALEHQANTAPGMKASLQLDVNTGVMRSEVENILPSPEVKTARKSRDRGRGTKQGEDTAKGHKPMKQVTSHTETRNGCVVTDATEAESPEKKEQKDNPEVNQTETPELAQNKTMNNERADRAANTNIGDGGGLEGKQEGISEPPSEDKIKEAQTIKAEANLETLSHDILENMEETQVVEPEAMESQDQTQTEEQDGTQAEASSREAAAQLIQTVLQGVNAHRGCSCKRCSECRLEDQKNRHRTANDIKRMVKEVELNKWYWCSDMNKRRLTKAG